MKIEDLTNYVDWSKLVEGYDLRESIDWCQLYLRCKRKHGSKLLNQLLKDNKVNLKDLELTPDECQVINDPINYGLEESAGIILIFNFGWEESPVGETNVSEAYIAIDLFYSMKDDKFFHVVNDS